MNKTELSVMESIGHVISLKANAMQQLQKLTELITALDELHALLIKKYEVVKQ